MVNLEPDGFPTLEKQARRPRARGGRGELEIILLTVLAVASFLTYLHDPPDQRDISEFYAGVVMLVMVVLGMSLRFVQETRADNAAAKLKAMIRVTATALRDGQRGLCCSDGGLRVGHGSLRGGISGGCVGNSILGSSFIQQRRVQLSPQCCRNN